MGVDSVCVRPQLTGNGLAGWPMALALGDTIQRSNRVPHL